MSMRLQELHPALVHFPIALLPTALGADALGRVTGNQALLQAGKQGIMLSAASALVSGLAGMVAQQTVKLDDHTTDMLITHRNLNLGLIGLTALMAGSRQRKRRPTLGYLALGAAGLAAMTYSAYLGGKMVYGHGVGVEAADGLQEDVAPELTRANAGEAARLSARHVQEGFQVTAQELAEGKLAPSLTGAGHRPEGGQGSRGEVAGSTTA